MSRALSLVCVFAFVQLAVVVREARAEEARPLVYPPPPAHMSVTPLEPNPYFVQDEHDPRILHPAPGAKERGVDRGYVERMARGASLTPALDVLDRDAPLPPGQTSQLHLPEPTALPLAATAVTGNVLVIEGNDSLTPMTQQGRMFDHRRGLETVVSQVWQRLGDNFDFITVLTTFKDAGVAAYYLPLKQDTAGLGECDFNSGKTFGCIFDQVDADLQGFVFMNSMSYWRDWDTQMKGAVQPTGSFDASVYAVMGQEVAHRWGAGLRFIDPRTGALSKKLLGRDESHWAAYVDTNASIHDGWDWESNGDGTFTLVDDMRRFSTLDLYAMGALPVAAAQPFFFIDNARFIQNRFVNNVAVPADAALQVPSVSLLAEYNVVLSATGEQVDLTIQDIVDAEGNRCPDPDHTQKSFRQAIVLVTAPGQTVASVTSYVQDIEVMMATWEDWWRDRTARALTLCTNLTETCDHAEMTIAQGRVEAEDEIVEAGDTFDLVVPVGAKNDVVVKNAVASVRLSGNGAEKARLLEESFALGDGSGTSELKVPISLDDDYGCGISLIARVTVTSDNAPDVSGEYRVFPGYRELFAATFDEGDDGFVANQDGLDENTRGGFLREEVSLNCTMTPRTPEDDSSPGKGGAFVTGSEGAELDGVASLFSPKIDLEGAVDPEIRFMYWLDGAPGSGKLKVSVSGSGKGFTEAKVYEEPYHGWVLGRVVLSEVYDEVPESVWLLIEAEGNGRVEAAIDEVRVLDRAGACAAAFTGCGCDSSKADDSGAPALVAGAGTLFLLARRRRRR